MTKSKATNKKTKMVKEVTVEVTKPKVNPTSKVKSAEKKAVKTPRVHYKKLNQELEAKLLKAQEKTRTVQRELDLTTNTMRDKMVYLSDVKSQGLTDRVGEWFSNQEILGQIVFTVATGLVTVFTGLGVYHVIAG